MDVNVERKRGNWKDSLEPDYIGYFIPGLISLGLNL